ncbi:DegV family protein [Ileibacterium valens]|uniref:Fatty acid-binding protein DegV n=1 Tax=Ileibacterium valens TaxID=1862668 RepID=A0A1U7NH73_9FIRM|nr:DegV family protein [Ileibacterium valens]OLU40889.1 hypothetical protein BO222_04175 [Ileibacterium valens]OLU42614.1 hypothetical protein BO224_01700 [Erysipelotrichaceae bacterium NYU-BL-E8]OLU42825.1 hypothetical protein BM735_01590 [Erysipelotrichaceae bacterium NYU-BL-F16]
MIWIVTDSAQELKNDPENGLIVMKLPIMINGEESKEEISKEKFYEMQEDDSISLKTSQATPADFEEVFRKITENGDEVLGVLLSSTLSGTYNSARLVAMDFDNIWLVDSGQAALSETALVKRAMDLRDQGLSAQQIAKQLEEDKKKVKLLAVVPTLKYLKKGGRISAAAAMAGDLIGIKPVVTIDEKGEVVVDSKARGLKKGIKNIVARAEEISLDPNMPIVIGYSGLNDTNAKNLKEQLVSLVDKDEDLVSLSEVLAVHAGPDAAGIGFFQK